MVRDTLVFHPRAIDETIFAGFAKPASAAQFIFCHNKNVVCECKK
jgi:hypothetical protein